MGQSGAGGPLALSADGQTLYVGHGSELVALRAGPRGGQVLWRRKLGAQPVTYVVTGGAALGHAVIACAGQVLALEPRTGKVTWRYGEAGARVCQTLALTPEGQVVAAGDGRVDLVERGGKRRWRYLLRGRAPAEVVAAADGTLYVASGGELRALLPTGELRWLISKENVARPLALTANGELLVGSWNGALLTIRPDGSVAGRLRTSGAPMPVVGKDGAIFAVDDNGYAYAIEGGVVRWKKHTEANIYSAPAIDRAGVIYLRSRVGTLWALGPDGNVRWQEAVGKAPGDVLLGPDGTLYVATNDPGVVAVRAGPPPTLAEKAWPMAAGDPQRAARRPLDKAARAENVAASRLTPEARALDELLAQVGGELSREGVTEDLSGPVAGGYARVLLVKELPDRGFAVVVQPRKSAAAPDPAMVTARLPAPYLKVAREVALEFKDLDGDGNNEILARTTSVDETPERSEMAVDLCVLRMAQGDQGARLEPIFTQLLSLKRNVRKGKLAPIALELELKLVPQATRYDLVLEQRKAELPPDDPRFTDSASPKYVDIAGRLGRYRLGENGYARLDPAAEAAVAPSARAPRPKRRRR